QLRTADAFLKMIHEYEDLMILSSKPYHFASLLFSESVMVSGRGALLQKIRTEYVQISNTLAFFSPELLAVDKSKLQKLAKNKALSEYHNYIASLIQYQRHELPEREKQIFSDLSLTGSSALNRMYDEEFAAREYEIKRGKKASFHSLSEALDLLHSSDRATRQAAQAGFSNGLIEDSRRITLIFNTLLQDKQVRDRYHKFENPEDARHLENQIPMKVVDALVRATKQSYRDVARFYEFKRDLLGYKKLYDYDRYAPIGHGRKIPWNDAKNYVIEAFEDFHPEFGRIAKEFFTRRWIDAEARPGKRGGAFCSFVTPDLHPYVFMNYGGTERDVFTLAHELGHAIHAYLMREQRYLNFDTPLTIAETASVFAELLLFYSLVDKMRSQEAKLALRVHHLENLIATIHRQVSMFLFERDVHAARRKGELHTEDFNRIWRARQEEMFRGSVELTPGYDYWWSYVPHFVHTPFYVYAYSFGQLFALGLYEKFEHQPEPFAQRYIEFLRSGNSKSPVELGHLLGVNLSRPEIWQNGVKTFRKMLLETEKLAG
ncbi:MAG: M3 family oligoendopeptidase, partial [Bdellovibrionales bacterium]|nr:M3 family oligoendopeptidase [Bdellovibrionales bacterium]